MGESLSSFSAPVRAWFEQTHGEPTPPQSEGWPPIQRGESTLILAPTGSGKTLAAFLWGIDQIGRELAASAIGPGVRLLYISPLKALNNDIERNLRAPLAGIRAAAHEMGLPWPRIGVAVRTGDTPASARAGMVKTPPHILITTPESLYLILTSPRAREMLNHVRSVIVDEIHTLVGDKRGAHLALSLERLEALTGAPIQRIGLSATIRPLEEAARFLGGQAPHAVGGVEGRLEWVARPVTVVDTGYRKPLDLQVVTPVDDFRNLPADSIWPVIIPQVLHDVMLHRTTLIFCNNRRLAERTADRLNAQIAGERSEEFPPGAPDVLAPGGVSRDKGMFAIGAEGPIRAHHGSMSREARRAMEEDLKAGRLPALVGTSSLELGIDMGMVDLVVQLQSPKSVAQGLQRVGRSGHLVGQTSRGRIYATFREDLVEAAAVARGMLEGDVEPTKSPRAPLDVLAQQVLAAVSVEPWDDAQLFAVVRSAYPYLTLTRADFDSVLEMLSGKYAAMGVSHPSLRARIAWDRPNGRLYPLPGSRLLALGNAGTITDRGAFDVVLADKTTRVGTLDEEFVFESRAGDAFILGSNVWRIQEIEDDRIVVGEAAGVTPRMPFWRGDYPWRPYELGMRIARLRREVGDRLRDTPQAVTLAGQDNSPLPDLVAWLQRDYALDERSARNLLDYVGRQLDAAGEIAADDAIVVESFTDAVGEARVVVHSPFGGRVNGAWALALGDALRERLGVTPETQANDDGILFRLPAGVNVAVVSDIIRAMPADDARARIVRSLPDSALFGAHFRMNAARALLLPRARGGKRTPFWLQRLKAKDLLAMTRRFESFPLLHETTRECLEDALDLPHLESLLDGILAGRVRVSAVESILPSPLAAGMLYNFVSTYMYEWDAPKAELQLLELAGQGEAASTGRAGALLRPEAVEDAVARASHIGPERGARSADELAVFFEELGDLTEEEALARCSPFGAESDRTAAAGRTWLASLAGAGRIVEMMIPTSGDPQRRYVTAELAGPYRATFERGAPDRSILQRYLQHSGPVSAADILDRYGFERAWLADALRQLEEEREIALFNPGEPRVYLQRRLFEQARRRTIAILRREVQPVSFAAYARFIADWQHVAGNGLPGGAGDVRTALEQLRGVALPGPLWEREVLPARLHRFAWADLAAILSSGEVVWSAAGLAPRHARVTFFPRGEGRLFLPPADDSGLNDNARAVYTFLREEGASPAADIERALRLPAAAVRAALVELALAQLATSDSGEGLRAVLGYEPSTVAIRPPVSALEAELSARRTRPAMLVRPRDHRRTGLARRNLHRLEQERAAGTPLPPADPWSGRWGLLHRTGVLGPPRSDDELAASRALALLSRYGVLTREALAREDGPFDWISLAVQLARMEMRGEVRRGYFVTGLQGVQYALPAAVEQLRAAASPDDNAPLVVLNAADPAQMYGATVTALVAPAEASEAETPSGVEAVPRFSRVPSTHLVFQAGRVLLLAEDGGERMWAPSDLPPERIRGAASAYLARPSAPRRVVLRIWNGAPALGSPAQDLLRPLGFTRTPGGLEHWE